MTGKQIKEEIRSIRKEVDSNKDKILIEIFKLAKTLVGLIYETSISEKTVLEILDEILELFETSFIETYKTTSQGIKKIYKDVLPFDEKKLEKLTYTEDGKIYKDRLEEYYIEILKDKKENRKEEDTLLRYEAKLERLLDTDTRHVETAVKLNKKPIGKLYVSIGGGCGNCIHGTFPEEAADYPPYHPNCACNWCYIRKEDAEDELDLMEGFEEE